MAEFFGIASGAIGVISVSIQLAESIQKAKAFYQSVKNAPPQIAELVEEFEILRDVFNDLGQERCAAAAASNTSSGTKSRLRGSVKFALGRDDINQMLQRLERTKSSLSLAHSLYRQVTDAERHVAVLQAISSSQVAVLPAPQSIQTAQDRAQVTSDTTIVPRRRMTHGDLLFRIRTPIWMSETIWQLQMQRSLGGLNIFLRTYGVVPINSSISLACFTGNITEMQRLFDSGKASPWDMTEHGANLWQIAAYGARIESLRFLSRYDAATIVDHEVLMALHALYYRAITRRYTIGHAGRDVREAMLWLQESFRDEICVSSAQYEVCWPWVQAERFLSYPSEDLDVEFFWCCIENGSLPLSEEITLDLNAMTDRFQPERHGGKSTLQLLAVVYATYASHPWPVVVGIEDAAMVTMVEKFAYGSNLHIGDHYHTPLLLFLSMCDWYISENTLSDDNETTPWAGPRLLNRSLRRWLRILQRAGVDLGYWGLVRQLPFTDDALDFVFTYGHEPEDWKVWMIHPVEEYAREFWEMLEPERGNIERSIPGGWVDG